MAFSRMLKAVLPNGLLANLSQWARKDIHEPDFEIFKHLSDVKGVCLDVGANRGYSATSVLRQTRRLRVVSVEPNKALRWALLLLGVLHPLRFRFHLFAAGANARGGILYAPGRTASSYDALASLDKDEFDKPHIREQLLAAGMCVNGKIEYRPLPVQVRPLDSLALRPSLIKVDVEGHERQVLEGLAETLRSELPALIVEMNHPERWVPILAELGYRFLYYDTQSRLLRPFEDTAGVQNLFCLHERNDSELTRKLLRLVKTEVI